MGGRGVIYTRISKDVTGERAGVKRQEELCRELAERRGIKVVGVYSDNDTSAFSGAKRRGYEDLLEVIGSGNIDYVIAWHPDRIYRRILDLEGYINACEQHKVVTVCVQSGDGVIDLSSPSGRMVARQLVSVAQYESEHKGERHRAANLKRAKEGKHFGTRRPFGWDVDGVTVRQDEHDALRDAIHAVIAGESLASIARDWNARGFRTPQAGNEWTSTVLGTTLRNPRLAGIRTYRRAILHGDDGEPVRGEWDAVVDWQTWRTCFSVLDAPSRKWAPQSRGLLSGVALCGVCDLVIVSAGTRKKVRRYRCGGMGGHFSREAPPVDDLVSRAVVSYLERPGIWQQIIPPRKGIDADRIHAELAELQIRSDELADLFTEGVFTAQQVRDRKARLDRKRDALEAQLPTAPVPALALLQDAPDVQAAWDAMSDDQRRVVIDSLLVVRLLPTGGKEAAYLDWRRRIIDPDTVRLEWRTDIKQPDAAPRRKKTLRPSE